MTYEQNNCTQINYNIFDTSSLRCEVYKLIVLLEITCLGTTRDGGRLFAS